MLLFLYLVGMAWTAYLSTRIGIPFARKAGAIFLWPITWTLIVTMLFMYGTVSVDEDI